MCRIGLVGFILACLVGTCSQSQAAGSLQTKPAFPKVVTAGVSVRTPTISAPDFRRETWLEVAEGGASAIPKPTLVAVRPTLDKQAFNRSK